MLAGALWLANHRYCQGVRFFAATGRRWARRFVRMAARAEVGLSCLGKSFARVAAARG